MIQLRAPSYFVSILTAVVIYAARSVVNSFTLAPAVAALRGDPNQTFDHEAVLDGDKEESAGAGALSIEDTPRPKRLKAADAGTTSSLYLPIHWFREFTGIDPLAELGLNGVYFTQESLHFLDISEKRVASVNRILNDFLVSIKERERQGVAMIERRGEQYLFVPEVDMIDSWSSTVRGLKALVGEQEGGVLAGYFLTQVVQADRWGYGNVLTFEPGEESGGVTVRIWSVGDFIGGTTGLARVASAEDTQYIRELGWRWGHVVDVERTVGSFSTP